MGRPSLGVKATVIRLSEDVRERIERLVGKNQMASFIREAVEDELKRRENAKKRKN
jgi:predicted DNA-binding protein